MKPTLLLIAATAVALVIAGAGLGSAGVRPGPSRVAAWLILAAAHAAWVHLDGRRRGVDVGLWPAAAAALGPLAVCAYLVVAYGPRAVAWGSFYAGLLSLLVGVAVFAAVWFFPICVGPP